MLKSLATVVLCWLISIPVFSQDDNLSKRTYLMVNSKRQLLGMPALAYRENEKTLQELEKLMSGTDFKEVNFCDKDCQWSVLITGKSMKEYHTNLTDTKWPYFTDGKRQITIASAVDPSNGSYWSVIYVY